MERWRLREKQRQGERDRQRRIETFRWKHKYATSISCFVLPSVIFYFLLSESGKMAVVSVLICVYSVKETDYYFQSLIRLLSESFGPLILGPKLHHRLIVTSDG